MKKLVALVLTLAMLLSLVAVAQAEDVTITYATFSASGAQEETLKKMVQVFEEKNPGIKVDVQLTGYGDYFTTLATKVAGGNAPDVFEMNIEISAVAAMTASSSCQFDPPARFRMASASRRSSFGSTNSACSASP